MGHGNKDGVWPGCQQEWFWAMCLIKFYTYFFVLSPYLGHFKSVWVEFFSFESWDHGKQLCIRLLFWKNLYDEENPDENIVLFDRNINA